MGRTQGDTKDKKLKGKIRRNKIMNNNNDTNDIEKYLKKGSHKAKEELSYAGGIIKKLSKKQKKFHVVRGTRLLANGKIKLNKRILDAIESKQQPLLFELDYSEGDIKDINKQTLYDLINASYIDADKILKTDEKEFFTTRHLFGPFKNLEIKKVYETYLNCKHNIKIFTAQKSKLTKKKNEIEKGYLICTKFPQYREIVFEQVEFYLENIYEELYKKLFEDEQKYINLAIEKLKILEKYFNDNGYNLENYEL